MPIDSRNMQDTYPRFFKADIAPSDTVIEFPEQEAQHALKVLRLPAGSPVEVVDGKGSLFSGVLQTTGKKRCHLEVKAYTHTPRNARGNVTLAVGLLKSNDRFQWIIEKCTELGVSCIIPLITSNAERRHFNREKALLTMVAGIKQSRQLWMPELKEACSCSEILALMKPHQQLLLAHCRVAYLPPLAKVWEREKDSVVLIGPEGDFTEEEVALLKENNAREISLGTQRLRTETAALKAVIALQMLYEIE